MKGDQDDPAPAGDEEWKALPPHIYSWMVRHARLIVAVRDSTEDDAAVRAIADAYVAAKLWANRERLLDDLAGAVANMLDDKR